MHKGFLRLAAILGALSVGLGAFGAHSLRTILPPEALNIFETGVRYQFYHVFALLATGILYKRFPVKRLRFAGFFFVSGIVLFSGSLYALATLAPSPNSSLRSIGIITPLGGVFLIIGWIFLLIGISNSVRTARSGQSNKL
jgi:uncharacterized membrane protein YgdD (TMEM256/DUF423 family)